VKAAAPRGGAAVERGHGTFCACGSRVQSLRDAASGVLVPLEHEVVAGLEGDTSRAGAGLAALTPAELDLSVHAAEQAGRSRAEVDRI
jgi:hypothetical protein